MLCAPRIADAELTQAELAKRVMPPYRLGEPVGMDGVWSIETSDGELSGYIFESRPLAPIPGFAGKPINLLITLARDGTFLDVTILEQNEPIFISGLGPGPFHAFIEQYRGLSVGDSITVEAGDRSASHAGSTSVYLDGVTKATASVRIANESILAAARQVARAQMQAIAIRSAARPRRDYVEFLDWPALIDEDIARNLKLSNQTVQAAFSGSLWHADDPEAVADPEGVHLDIWVIDVGPPSIARVVLDDATRAALGAFLEPTDEPLLLLANGRHQLVNQNFVRNTVVDRFVAMQDGIAYPLHDADIDVGLVAEVPGFEQAMLLRLDTRLGFNPTAPWTLLTRVVREHGSFRPEAGSRDFELEYQAPSRFFHQPTNAHASSPWLKALEDRRIDIVLVLLFVAPLLWLLSRRLRPLARHPRFALFRLSILAIMVGFIGWYAQGQLSIVTPLAVLHNAIDGGSLAFLLYEPVILLLWVITLGSLVLWGRGFFCGWLCPYGALQEFAYHLGRMLRLNELRIHPLDDRRLKRVKYIVLSLLVLTTLTSTTAADLVVEVEPFKTAITMHFDRALPYVLYALFWLALGFFLFKGFCRYVCPLGAALALAGKVRRMDWIRRRDECGTPCQFCKARCAYGAIEPDGRIDYDECFQCLECVTIIEEPELCVPERLKHKKGRRLSPVTQ
ncbi:MAG: 4Fe-4S binding protein [Hyphomicrobiales bacterium]|nr:4Fe-4S binding protein [Hyphomicrobiales bacterium]